MNNKRILIIGYGNPGRLDDGLGPALAEKLEKENLPGVTIEADYQLTVEDAHLIAKNDICIFADADVSGPEPFYFRKISPSKNALSFSSHGAEPGHLIALANELFGGDTETYALGIRGYEFNEFGEKISSKARANLDKAYDFLVRTITDVNFSEAALLHASRN